MVFALHVSARTSERRLCFLASAKTKRY